MQTRISSEYGMSQYAFRCRQTILFNHAEPYAFLILQKILPVYSPVCFILRPCVTLVVVSEM